MKPAPGLPKKRGGFGRDLKAYAEKAGKVYQTLVKKLWAWRVLAVIHVDNVDEQDLFNGWRHNQVDNPHGVGEFEDYLKEFYADRAKRIDIARDSWRNLAEIHAAPKWLSTCVDMLFNSRALRGHRTARNIPSGVVGSSP